MKKLKVMLAMLLVIVMISLSVLPSFAVVAPEDSVVSNPLWSDKIDKLVWDKISEVSADEEIPVWVWLTDIDVDALEKDIETKTGLSQQKLSLARSEIKYDISNIDSKNVSSISTLNESQVDADKTVFAYLESTKSQREELSNDTEIYLSIKKTLARQQYISANTTKLRRLDISSEKIEFKSELTPTFIAFLTKDEIVETAKSSDVVEIGYFSEYDGVYNLELDEEPQREQTSIASTSDNPYTGPIAHDGLKQALQYDLALDKYGMTGDGINILHIDGDFVRSNISNAALIPNIDNIRNVINKQDYPAENHSVLPPYYSSHANHCLAYLQTFAEDANIYCVAKYATFDQLGINAYDDIEYSINNFNIDLISCSGNEGTNAYNSNFSAKWFDAIISMYNIPLVASAGNDIPTYPYPIAPSSGYNSIAVGAYDYDKNRMRDNYTYNPLLESKTRVWYKPDLVVAMDKIPSENPGYVVFGGTSSGAPVVSGIVAMMMQLDPSLIGQPEVVKAILMASCHEKALRSNADAEAGVSQESMESGLTLKQGAGKVNVLRALNIVAFGTYGYGLLMPEQNGSTIKRFYLNSAVNGGDTDIYPVNVSTSWLRRNVKTGNIKNESAINLGEIYQLNLTLYRTTESGLTELTSSVSNSGKQLVFFANPELDKEYGIRIHWNSSNVEDRGLVYYGYAYSVGNFEKVLGKVEITGYTAVGKTLTASAYTVDNLPANPSALTYRWYSSANGTSWQSINGATSSTYTLTDLDLGKYFKCCVEQDYLEELEVAESSKTKVVRFGDVDGSGEVTVLDATKIRFYVNGSINLTDEQLISADVNGDGNVTFEDATLVQQFLAGIINKFPVEE